MDVLAPLLPAATSVPPRRDAKVVLPATTAAVDTVVALLVVVTVTTDTVVCPLVATLPHTHLVIHTTDTDLLLAVVPSRLLPCVETLTTATVAALLPCAVTTLPAETATTFPHLPVVVQEWTTLLATSHLAVHQATTLLLAATAIFRHLLPVVVATMTCPLPLHAPAVQEAGTLTHHLVLVTMMPVLPRVATKPQCSPFGPVQMFPSIMLH